MKNGFFLLLFFISCTLFDEDNSNNACDKNLSDWLSLANTPYPILRHDPQGTNRSQYAGIKQSTNTILIGDSILDNTEHLQCDIVFDEDENIVMVTSDWNSDDPNYLLVMDQNGKEIIKIELPNTSNWENNAAATIASDGSIYLSAISPGEGETVIYAFNNQYELVWSFTVNSYCSQAISLDLDGNLYFSCDDNTIYSLTPDGELRWELTIENGVNSYYSPLVYTNDGDQFYCAGDTSINAISLDGVVIWSYDISIHVSNPIIDNKNNIVFYNSLDSSITSLDRNGELNWKTNIFDIGMRYIYHTAIPTIDIYNNLYFNGQKSNNSGYSIFSLDANDGSFRWTYDVGAYDLFSDCEGFIYGIDYSDRSVFCINSDGTFESTIGYIPVNGHIWDSPIISSEGKIFVPIVENFDTYIVGFE